MSSLEFEWDEDKNRTNIRKHGISFELASYVFSDISRIEIYDTMHSTNIEDRYITIGYVGELLFVVYTERRSKTRLISARLATSEEKELYYDENILY